MLEVVEERRGADEADLAPALARLLDDAGKPDLILSALPGEQVVKRMLSLPFKDSAGYADRALRARRASARGRRRIGGRLHAGGPGGRQDAGDGRDGAQG